MLLTLKSHMGSRQGLSSEEVARDSGRGLAYPACKRAFDIVAALSLLVIAFPLLLAIGLLVKLTSRGPVVYRQDRLGKAGRRFTMYKLRTMAHDCERLTGPVWSTENDPRVTLPGRFLRKTHLDEVPQLWNILKGEMSFVGPRPERPEIADQLALDVPHYRERLDVAPGLTGLAQVQIPPDDGLESVRTKLALDLEYVRTVGLVLDGKLLLCTALFLGGIPFRLSCRLLLVPSLTSCLGSGEQSLASVLSGFDESGAFATGEGRSMSLPASL